jgi:hypothetical protein
MRYDLAAGRRLALRDGIGTFSLIHAGGAGRFPSLCQSHRRFRRPRQHSSITGKRWSVLCLAVEGGSSLARAGRPPDLATNNTGHVCGSYIVSPLGPVDVPAKDGLGHPGNGPETGHYNPKIIGFLRCHDPCL